jgi:hypothetical protein
MIRGTVIYILDTTLSHLRHKCPPNITDLVFLEIERRHMSEYESAVNHKGTDTINKFIDKFIREHWNLKNLGRNNSPSSRLITSYELHSN